MVRIEKNGQLFSHRTELWLALLLTLASFGLRVHQIGFYSLSEDEAAKWQAVQQYREGHFAGVNGEHPMLMKLLAWGSVSLGEQWNVRALQHGWPSVSAEASLRLPNVILGAATTFVLYLFSRALMGSVGALATTCFWAFSPMPIALNRLLKEETPLVFFSLLACYFYLRAKKASQECQTGKWLDLSAITFGLSFASKYAPQLLGLNALAWYLAGRTGLDSRNLGSRLPRFFVLIAITFVAINPVIVVPADLQSMFHWVTAGGAHHTGYNLAGKLYLNQPSLRQPTLPWYFYSWLLLVKTPLPVLASILAGSLLLLRRRDSLMSVFFLSFGFIQLLGLSAFPGKWIRYSLGVLPFLFLAAGYAAQQLYEWLSSRGVSRQMLGFATVVLISWAYMDLRFWDPYYSLYLNGLGGGATRIARYFSPDEISELDARETAAAVCRSASYGTRLATSKPLSMTYYLERYGHKDISVIPLYDPGYTPQDGDLILAEDSRRYFETDKLLQSLRSSRMSHEDVKVGPVLATTIYRFEVPPAREDRDTMSTILLAKAKTGNTHLRPADLVPATKLAMLGVPYGQLR